MLARSWLHPGRHLTILPPFVSVSSLDSLVIETENRQAWHSCPVRCNEGSCRALTSVEEAGVALTASSAVPRFGGIACIPNWGMALAKPMTLLLMSSSEGKVGMVNGSNGFRGPLVLSGGGLFWGGIGSVVVPYAAVPQYLIHISETDDLEH